MRHTEVASCKRMANVSSTLSRSEFQGLGFRVQVPIDRVHGLHWTVKFSEL